LPEAVEFDLELHFHSDFADPEATARPSLVLRGSLESRRGSETRTLTTNYRAGDFGRGLRVQVQKQRSEPEYANGLLSFRDQARAEGGAGTLACCGFPSA
jgi:hypothetical protein